MTESTVGELMSRQYDFEREFKLAVKSNPVTARMFELIDDPWLYEGGYGLFNHRLTSALGHAVLNSEWWTKNKKRFVKDRENYHKVRYVQES